MPIVYAGVSLGLMGLLFGAILAYAARIFAVEVDERVALITDCLPGANCGGCGFAGCGALAGAIVEGKAPVNACPAGGTSSAEKIAEIMGVAVVAGERKVAHVMCCGSEEVAHKKCKYVGIDDCLSAMRYAGGDKACSFGCTGLGSCVEACKFNAIEIKGGVAVVNKDVCVSCGACVQACPRKLITMVSAGASPNVECMNKDKGAQAKDLCGKACIGCMICQKNCPNEAITVNNFLAQIDNSKCVNCGVCVSKCPRKCITSTES